MRAEEGVGQKGALRKSRAEREESTTAAGWECALCYSGRVRDPFYMASFSWATLFLLGFFRPSEAVIAIWCPTEPRRVTGTGT